MKKNLIFSIFLVFALCLSVSADSLRDITGNDISLKAVTGTSMLVYRLTYSYDDLNAFYYGGRYNETTNGMWVGWTGAWIEMDVYGAMSYTAMFHVIDTSTSFYGEVHSLVDNGANDRDNVSITTAAETGIVDYKMEFYFGDRDAHKIFLQPRSSAATQFVGDSKIFFLGVETNLGGVVTSSVRGSAIVQAVGDSWMSGNDWTRLMDRTHWSIYHVSLPGWTCANMVSSYPYDYSEHANTTDPTADVVIISFGVNDFLASVTTASFHTSLLALIDLIQAKQTSVPIVLIRVPKNLSTGKDFGQYGTVMNTATGERDDVYYIDTTSLDASVTWLADTYHLDYDGSVVLANYIDTQLKALGF